MIQGFQIDIMKGLFIKGTANWYYSEGLYESFTKDYMDNMLTEHYTKTRTSTAKFERNFAQTYNAGPELYSYFCQRPQC